MSEVSRTQRWVGLTLALSVGAAACTSSPKHDTSEQPVATPAFSCDYLTVRFVRNNPKEIQVGTTHSATNGATYLETTFSFGDGSDDATVDEASKSEQALDGEFHTYTTDGTFVVRATVGFIVNSTYQVATSHGCQRVVPISTS